MKKQEPRHGSEGGSCFLRRSLAVVLIVAVFVLTAVIAVFVILVVLTAVIAVFFILVLILVLHA